MLHEGLPERHKSTGQGTKMTWDLSQGVFLINSPTRNMERLETLWKRLPQGPSTKNLRWRQLQRRLGEGSALGGIQAEAQVGMLRNESVGYSQRCDTGRPSCPSAARHVYLGLDLMKKHPEILGVVGVTLWHKPGVFCETTANVDAQGLPPFPLAKPEQPLVNP